MDEEYIVIEKNLQNWRFCVDRGLFLRAIISSGYVVVVVIVVVAVVDLAVVVVVAVVGCFCAFLVSFTSKRQIVCPKTESSENTITLIDVSSLLQSHQCRA